ncbi:MAG: BMP family protein [Roseobacter sp.]
MKISILFIGALNDGGFNQSALHGAQRLHASGDHPIKIISDIPYDQAAMSAALSAAAKESDGIVFVGGQGNLVTPPVAAAFPDRSFAIVQGNMQTDNIASYDVLQEQSAFLAGVLAARMTQSGIVGHLSGHRIVPGLKGRAAFVSGVRYVDSGLPILTGFCGTQDDNDTTETWTRDLAAAGADVIFTMLNAARSGATKACRETAIRQIGNVSDWCAQDPDVFVASALARIDKGIVRAVSDMRAGILPDTIRHLGLAEDVVGLSVAPDVTPAVRDEIAVTRDLIAAGKLAIETTYDGPEFEATT